MFRQSYENFWFKFYVLYDSKKLHAIQEDISLLHTVIRPTTCFIHINLDKFTHLPLIMID